MTTIEGKIKEFIDKMGNELYADIVQAKKYENDEKVKHVYIGKVVATKNHIKALSLLIQNKDANKNDDDNFFCEDVYLAGEEFRCKEQCCNCIKMC